MSRRRHRYRKHAVLGVAWTPVSYGSVTQRRVPEGGNVCVTRIRAHLEMAAGEAGYGLQILESMKVYERRRKIRGVSDRDIRYGLTQAGREGEHLVRAVIWLLRMLAPGGWRGPEIERNALKRARIDTRSVSNGRTKEKDDGASASGDRGCNPGDGGLSALGT